VSLRRWLPAAGIGTVLGVGVVLASLAVGRAAQSEHDDERRHAASIAVDRIAATIERDIVEMERLAVVGTDAAAFRVAAEQRLDGVPELVATALARLVDGKLVVATAVPTDAGPLASGTDLAADPEVDIVVTRAITEADAAAGTPFEIDGRSVIAVAAPVLEVPAGPESERRSSVRGAVLGALDANELIGDAWDGEIRLVAADGRAAGDDATGSVLSRFVDIRGRSWTVLVDADDDPWPVSAWLVLGLGGLVAALVTVVVDREVRRRRAAEAQAANRSLQLERIADAGARLQQSLDLAELLPAFSVALAADFDLQGVSVALLDGEGLLTEAFSTGDRTQGGSIELPLRRGWRAVGVLTVRPGRALDGAELTSLQALGDLLAVAMSNAQLYEREQLNATRLRDLDALKNAFLGTVSHELRTSMTAIMGFGELLSESWDNLDEDRRREMAMRIRRSAGSLRHLVDDLLDFARLEQERLRVSPRVIDLASIVRITIDGLTPLLNHHTLELDADDPVSAWADPVAVERILANLVSNAAKYAPNGSTVSVSVTSADAGTRARLVVADQGPGIPAEERRRIFARFYRLDTPESIRTRGAGIGLAILRDFADRSGATVGVDDAPGGGARFTIDFPTDASQLGPVDAPLAEAR
jgi:signal transduction histidine kinase